MPFEDPNDVQDPISGDDILSAWGDAVRQSLLTVAAPPTVRAQRGTTQTINDSTDTGIAADAVTYQSHVLHSVVSGVSRFTVPAGWGGEFELGVQTRWQENNNGMRRTYIRLNGSLIIAGDSRTTGWSGGCEQTVVTSWQAVAGDYFEFFVWHDAGSTPGTTTPGVTLDLQPLDYSAQVMWARWVRLSSTVAAS